jgi:hypothetical protein
MSLVSLDLAKQQIRVFDTTEDQLVQTYIDAAESHVAQFLGRAIYPDVDTMAAAVIAGTAGLNPIVINPRIIAAVLLLVAGWYANREYVITEQAHAIELPVGVTALLFPDRVNVGI